MSVAKTNWSVRNRRRMEHISVRSGGPACRQSFKLDVGVTVGNCNRTQFLLELLQNS